MAGIVADCLGKGGMLLVCGNGGSAADAQHFAGELVGRFMIERAPLRCIALSANTAVLTAIGNDYGFEHVFARQVAAHGREGDVLLAISTSGKSPNILEAVSTALRLKMRVLALSGRDGGPLARLLGRGPPAFGRCPPAWPGQRLVNDAPSIMPGAISHGRSRPYAVRLPCSPVMAARRRA